MRNRLFSHVSIYHGKRVARIAVATFLGITVLALGVATVLAISGKTQAPTARADQALTVDLPNSDLTRLSAANHPLSTSSSAGDVAAKLLYTNVAYRNLSADLNSLYRNGKTSSASFAVEQPDKFRITANDGQREWIAVSDGEDVWVHHPGGVVEPRKNASRLAATVPPSDPRPNHLVLPVSGTELPIGGAANSMLHPHGLAQSIIPRGLARIIGTANVGSREGIVLEVTANPARANAWVPSWHGRKVYVIDTQTGIILRQQQFSQEGKLETSDELSNVRIDAPGFNADFSLTLGPGERLGDYPKTPAA